MYHGWHRGPLVPTRGCCTSFDCTPRPAPPPPPQGIEIEVKGRRVRVKGPRGVLVRDFRHLAVDMFLGKDEEGETILTVR